LAANLHALVHDSTKYVVALLLYGGEVQQDLGVREQRRIFCGDSWVDGLGE